MKVTQPKMHPKWRTPRPKAFRPEGVTYGAEVVNTSRLPGTPRTGQVWAKAPGARTWWVVSPDGEAFQAYEGYLQVIGQADAPTLAISA